MLKAFNVKVGFSWVWLSQGWDNKFWSRAVTISQHNRATLQTTEKAAGKSKSDNNGSKEKKKKTYTENQPKKVRCILNLFMGGQRQQKHDYIMRR